MFRLVYVSAATRPLAADALLAILRASRANNAARAITGLLLYRDGDIMQVLEGDEQAVRALLAAIERDPRHHRLLVIHEETGGERLFADWSMAYRNLEHADPAQIEGFNRCLAARGAVGLHADADHAVVELLRQFGDARSARCPLLPSSAAHGKVRPIAAGAGSRMTSAARPCDTSPLSSPQKGTP